MTLRSVNEIEVTLRKAAVGAGWPLGLAEEAGRSAAWLAATGTNGVGMCVDALSEPFTGFDGFQERDGTAFVGTPVNALWFGPAVADRLYTGDFMPVSAAAVVSPLLCLPPVAEAARTVGVPLIVAVDGEGVACLPEGVVLRAGWPDMAETASVGINLVKSVALDGACKNLSFRYKQSLENGIPVADTDWVEAVALAAKTMVPATEGSRQAGAGAGAIDNE
ncbi:MAG: DUF3726 domain-containing protein [Alphaproteobacteria bacterium]